MFFCTIKKCFCFYIMCYFGIIVDTVDLEKYLNFKSNATVTYSCIHLSELIHLKAKYCELCGTLNKKTEKKTQNLPKETIVSIKFDNYIEDFSCIKISEKKHIIDIAKWNDDNDNEHDNNIIKRSVSDLLIFVKFMKNLSENCTFKQFNFENGNSDQVYCNMYFYVDIDVIKLHYNIFNTVEEYSCYHYKKKCENKLINPTSIFCSECGTKQSKNNVLKIAVNTIDDFYISVYSNNIKICYSVSEKCIQTVNILERYIKLMQLFSVKTIHWNIEDRRYG